MKKVKKEKKLVDPNKPKRNISAYLLFSKVEIPKMRSELREKGEAFTHQTLMTGVGSRWNELPVEEKQRYVVQAEADREAYTKSLENYEKGKTAGSISIAAESAPKPSASMPSSSVQHVPEPAEVIETSDDGEKKKKKKHRRLTEDSEVGVEAEAAEEVEAASELKKKKKKKKSKHHDTDTDN